MRISHGKMALLAGLFLVAGATRAEPPPVPAAGEAPSPRVSPSPGLAGSGAGLQVLPPPAGPPGVAHGGCQSPCGSADCGVDTPRSAWRQGQPGPTVLPLGYVAGLHFRTQVENGVAARMTLYDYDFVCGTEQLNLRGKDRLFQIALLLGHNTHPVLIERTPHAPALAEARRLAVLMALSQGPVPAPPERVVIGHPLAVPWSGWEAEAQYLNLLQQAQTGIRPIPLSGAQLGFTTGGR